MLIIPAAAADLKCLPGKTLRLERRPQKRWEGGVCYLVIEQPKPGQIPLSDPALQRNRGARFENGY
jgi:hypothetical protein